MDEARVAAGDDGRGLAVAGRCDDLDIQFFRNPLLQLDVDSVLCDILFSRRERFGRQVAQHFEAVLALADERTQGDGDRQAGHARAGDAHTHRVLEDVRAQQRFDLFRLAAQLLDGAGRTQGDSHRFGAADGRHHFLVNQRKDTFSDMRIDHFIRF